MPWTCCEQELPDASPVCPSCGETKTNWTVRFEKTRMFQIGQRKLWVELRVRDQGGLPLSGQRYEVTFPDGFKVEGKLDDQGQARVERGEKGKKGLCEVRFPDIDARCFTPFPEPELGIERDTFLAAVLRDPWGRPRMGVRYRVETGQGQPIEGETDEDGLVLVEHLAAGTCKLTFPGLDAPCFAPFAGDTLGGPGWLSLQLRDPFGRPLAGRRFVVGPAGEAEVEGETDEAGWARVEGLPPGAHPVRFLDLDQTCFAPFAGDTLGGPGWLSLQLRDPFGRPLAGRRFVVAPAGEAEVEGETDEAGWARVEGLPPGAHPVRFLDLDQTCFAPF
ncbi:MAG: hypothetical protein AB7N76_37255, partial [Planctomycetota bacterium]